eukprot:232891_1
MASLVSQSEHKNSENEYDQTCDSVENCAYLQRLCKALQFYQSNKESNHKAFLNYFSSQHYDLLLTDYHHILNHHLEQKSLIDTQHEFELIHNTIIRSIDHCSLDQCNKFKRNNRNRSKLKVDPSLTDAKIRFYTDTLDTIHCYFVHSYDIGFRLKSDQIKTDDTQRNDAKQSDDEDMDESNLYKDHQMEQFKRILQEKQKHLRSIRGTNRMQHNKFLTKMESDTEPKPIKSETETKSEKETERANDTTYSFGHRHYYWDYFKDNDETERSGANEGYPYKYWYIVKKYSSLKTELLSNTIRTLTLQEFQNVQFRAYQNLQSLYCRHKIGATGDLLDQYNIEPGLDIDLENIMVVILYCDYDELSFSFSQTFRKLHRHESDESLKQRNSEFFNWSKRLRETVECYGTQVMESKVDVYYHGVSYLLLDSFVSYFCAPTSTTCQICVAITFAKDDGLILDLGMDEGRLSFFNCSWLSCYGNEDERLFFGGFKPLAVKSVRWMKTNENYKLYIKSFALFNYVITSDYPLPHERKLITKTNYNIIKRLMTNVKVKLFPKYVIDIWNAFCLNQQLIKIRLEYLHKYYKGFRPLLINEKCSNLLRLYDLCLMFRNCRKIVVDFVAEHKYRDNNMDAEFLSELFGYLDAINDAIKKGIVKLKTIQFKYVKYNHLTPSKDAFLESLHLRQFKTQIEAIQWSVSIDGKDLLIEKC